MEDKQVYFDVKLVRQLESEVTCGPIGEKATVKVDESKSEWFAKEKLGKLKSRLIRVRQLYKKNPKESEKYEREGVALESDIKELEDKIAEFAAKAKELKMAAKAKTEVKEEVETMPTTEPTTKPETMPKPKTPLSPAPHISPKPKAGVKESNPDVNLFIKART